VEKVVIVGFKPIEQYFRKGIFYYAKQYDLELIYVLVLGRKLFLTTMDDELFSTREITYYELLKIKNLSLMIFNLGLNSFVKLFLLKLLLKPQKIYWDYIDNLYYGNETLRNFLYHKLFEKFSDGVLVLNSILSYRFKNSICWDNASHLNKLILDKNQLKVIGTISSIDSRFDFESYEYAISNLPNYKFYLYGWVKNDNRNNFLKLENLKKYKNFEYFGSYDNDDLEVILKKFSIGLIPYKISALTLYINPDKYYHYSNAGLNIISSFIPAIVGKTNLFFYSSKYELVNLLSGDFSKEYINYSWEENIKIIKDIVCI